MVKRADVELNEGINVLPDELLVFILSFLSLKEAVATSILCSRWRHLWTFIDKLDFDGLDFFNRIWSRTKGFKYANENFLNEIWTVSKNLEEIWNYIAWVDNVLGFHKSCSIDEFRVDFFLAEAHKKHIDRWLRFVSAKKVKRLELNLRWKWCCESEAYVFPYELLMSFQHLRTLRMHWVNVSGECLELLLGTCPLLEELCVYYSEPLTALKIIGPSLALKRLEIVHCYSLTSVEIHDVNLLFFMYHGDSLKQFVLKDVPQLVEMDLGGEVLRCMRNFLSMFSSCLPQLKKLTMYAFCMNFLEDESARMFYNEMKMSNLQKLVFKFLGPPWNLMTFNYFLCASPMLQSFVLESFDDRSESCYFPKMVEPPYDGYQYPHLKRVEFLGYCGTSGELDLAEHLLENGVALEKFVIDLRRRDNTHDYFNLFWPNRVHGRLAVDYENTQEDKINAAKADVRRHLTQRVPSTLQHLNLSIL